MEQEELMITIGLNLVRFKCLFMDFITVANQTQLVNESNVSSYCELLCYLWGLPQKRRIDSEMGTGKAAHERFENIHNSISHSAEVNTL